MPPDEHQEVDGTYAKQLAEFVRCASIDALLRAVRVQRKVRVGDLSCCAFGALGSNPVQVVRTQVEE